MEGIQYVLLPDCISWTSQKPDPHGGYSARDRIASFVGIIPADRPRLVVLVVIDTPRTAVYGGEVAAPVFQAIAKQSLAYLGIEGEKPQVSVIPAIIPPPSAARENGLRHTIAVETPSPQDDGQVGEETNSEQDFVGMSLREAVLTAHRNGVQLVTRGSGYVKAQKVRKNSTTPVYELTLTSLGGNRP